MTSPTRKTDLEVLHMQCNVMFLDAEIAYDRYRSRFQHNHAGPLGANILSPDSFNHDKGSDTDERFFHNLGTHILRLRAMAFVFEKNSLLLDEWEIEGQEKSFADIRNNVQTLLSSFPELPIFPENFSSVNSLVNSEMQRIGSTDFQSITYLDVEILRQAAQLAEGYKEDFELEMAKAGVDPVDLNLLLTRDNVLDEELLEPIDQKVKKGILARKSFFQNLTKAQETYEIIATICFNRRIARNLDERSARALLNPLTADFTYEDYKHFKQQIVLNKISSSTSSSMSGNYTAQSALGSLIIGEEGYYKNHDKGAMTYEDHLLDLGVNGLEKHKIPLSNIHTMGEESWLGYLSNKAWIVAIPTGAAGGEIAAGGVGAFLSKSAPMVKNFMMRSSPYALGAGVALYVVNTSTGHTRHPGIENMNYTVSNDYHGQQILGYNLDGHDYHTGTNPLTMEIDYQNHQLDLDSTMGSLLYNPQTNRVFTVYNNDFNKVGDTLYR